MTLPTPATRLSDNELLELGQHHFRMADRDRASPADLTALCDLVPALLHRPREHAQASVLDLSTCGVELPDYEDEQMEMHLPKRD